MIEPESKEFMKFVKEFLSDSAEYETSVLEIRHLLKEFYDLPPDEIRRQLMNKLRKGAEEHGEPVYTPHQLKIEFQAELIDLLGWYMIGLWQQERKARGKA